MKKTVKLNLNNTGKKGLNDRGMKQKKLKRIILNAIESGSYPYSIHYAGKCDGYECPRSVDIDKNSNGIILRIGAFTALIEPYDNKMIVTDIPIEIFKGMTSIEVQQMLMGREYSKYKLWDLWKR